MEKELEDFNIKAYECDPKKATGCKKTACYLNGGECRLTHKKEWAKDDPWNDPEDPPKDDRFVLISFANYSVPCVGRYEQDENGDGTYYEGDEDRSLASYGVVVNGWMELPKCRRER